MIDILDVSKKFRLYSSPLERVKDWAGLAVRTKEFWAVRHFTLSVPRGRTVGIVGPNGAGKSTLLKLITGTLLPTTGTIRVHGRVAALLELGTGFHPEFTGRQNIHINGQLLGLSATEIASHEQAIVDFSELGMFIDQPLRTYSSGMIVRLGFAIAASVHPDVLIVDEALSVGDARFSQKCIRRIRQFREEGTTILFVSHDPGAVLALCDEAVLLNEGQLLQQGDPADIMDSYNAILAAKGEGNVEMRFHRVGEREDGPAPVRTGTFQALIRRTELLNSKGTATDLFRPGEPLTIRVVVDFLAPIARPTIGILIKDRLGIEVYGTNSALLGVDTGSWAAGETLTMEFALPLDIGHGDYTLTVAVHDDETHLEACFDWSDRMAAFRVRFADKPTWKGLARLSPAVSHHRDHTNPLEQQHALEDIFGDIGAVLDPRSTTPSPFLSGFYPCEESSGVRFRWVGTQGTFLLRPEQATVELELGFDGRDAAGLPPAELTLLLVGHGEIARCSASGKHFTLRAMLPEEVIGRLSLFKLTVDPPFIPAEHGGTPTDTRALGAVLYGARASTRETRHHAPA